MVHGGRKHACHHRPPEMPGKVQAGNANPATSFNLRKGRFLCSNGLEAVLGKSCSTDKTFSPIVGIGFKPSFKKDFLPSAPVHSASAL